MSCQETATAMIDGLSIESNKTEVLLGMNVDLELKFDETLIICVKKQVRSSMFLPVLHIL